MGRGKGRRGLPAIWIPLLRFQIECGSRASPPRSSYTCAIRWAEPAAWRAIATYPRLRGPPQHTRQRVVTWNRNWATAAVDAPPPESHVSLGSSSSHTFNHIWRRTVQAVWTDARIKKTPRQSNHPFCLKYTYGAPPTRNMIQRAIGYPRDHVISGICSKFIP